MRVDPMDHLQRCHALVNESDAYIRDAESLGDDVRKLAAELAEMRGSVETLAREYHGADLPAVGCLLELQARLCEINEQLAEAHAWAIKRAAGLVHMALALHTEPELARLEREDG